MKSKAQRHNEYLRQVAKKPLLTKYCLYWHCPEPLFTTKDKRQKFCCREHAKLFHKLQYHIRPVPPMSKEEMTIRGLGKNVTYFENRNKQARRDCTEVMYRLLMQLLFTYQMEHYQREKFKGKGTAVDRTKGNKHGGWDVL